MSARTAAIEEHQALGALLDAVERERGPEHDAALTALYALDAEDADLAPALLGELARRPRGEARVR